MLFRSNNSNITVSGNVIGATTLNNSTTLAVTGNLQSTLDINQSATANIQTGGRVTGQTTVNNSGSLTVNGTSGNIAQVQAVTITSTSGSATIGQYGNATGAVISNGTAILGLGDLGALASKPVMEGKSVLFKRFADVDSIDIEVSAKDPEIGRAHV